MRRSLLVLFLFFAVAFARLDETPRIAVISAFPAELTVLLEHAQVHETHVLNGRSFHLGTLEGKDVVMFLSGISMENAAMTTQLGLSHFNVTHIIYSGIAGGVNPELNIGDVTIPRQWGLYQKQLFAREVDGEFHTGNRSVPFGGYGMMYPQTVSVAHVNGEPDVEEERFWFEVDEALLALASVVLHDVELTHCTVEGVCLDRQPQIVIGGNGVSGPTFVDNAAYREWVWETFQADALDMETTATALVAFSNGVPYIAIRSLSDLAGGDAGENPIRTFFQLAADNSARVVLELLKHL